MLALNQLGDPGQRLSDLLPLNLMSLLGLPDKVLEKIVINVS